jgi:hypothetical protein
VSLKDTNGYTVSALRGAGTLFDKMGKINAYSSILPMLHNFGVDFKEVQNGFNLRNGTNHGLLPYKEYFGETREELFRNIWGYNYFYVKNTVKDWKVMWIDELKLKELSSNIKVTNITYPGLTSKQISIYCSNDFHKYKIDIRNSKGGEYPNDIKVKYL